MQGIVFDIKNFELHDGPGIRTTVFLKGCPLRCLWCHNPESQAMRRELSYAAEKCLDCGDCVPACTAHCHSFVGGRHLLDRLNCTNCGACASKCLPRALEMIGKTMTADEVIAEICKDRIFYAHSGGGMTLSGGEPMAQFEFTRELLKKAKEAGLHNCLETCGFSPFEQFASIVEYVDLFLFDIKAADPGKHLALTGVDNRVILNNLHQLDSMGAKLILRCPLVPGLNDDDAHLCAVGQLANELENVEKIELEAYHCLGEKKYTLLGREIRYSGDFVPEEKMTGYINMIRQKTSVPVIKA